MDHIIFGSVAIVLGLVNLAFAKQFFKLHQWMFINLMGLEIKATSKFYTLTKVMSFIVMGFGLLVIVGVIKI